MKKLKNLLTDIPHNSFLRSKWFIVIAVIMLLLGIGAASGAYILYTYWYPPVLVINDEDVGSVVQIETNKGDITITLDRSMRFPVAQFTRLIRSGFYDGTKFHRVVPRLLIEGGDPLTKDSGLKALWGQGGTSAVFHNEYKLTDKMSEGTVALSGSAVDTYGSHFMIVTQDTPWLVGKHTIIGHVTKGMDVVHLIEAQPLTPTGLPVEDIVLESITVQ